jgi:hypothetical protein
MLLIFHVTGNQELISQMLQSSAKGEIGGITFTAFGPFSMWIITIVILKYGFFRYISRNQKLVLHFPLKNPTPPNTPHDFNKVSCTYSIFHNNQKVVTDKPVTVHTEKMQHGGYIPYIYIENTTYDDALVQVSLKFGTDEWISDSYSPNKGDIDLQ